MTMTLKELQQLVSHVESLRTTRLAEQREIGAIILPSRGVFPGEEKDGLRNRRLFNNAAQRALRKAAAGITEGMTPANLPWFKHDFLDPAQREMTGTRQFADQIDERLYAALAAGGFYQAIHNFNKELLAFGCALLTAEEGFDPLVRYSCQTCGTYAIAMDRKDSLKCVVRRLTFGVRELISRFGKDRVSEGVRSKAEREPYSPVNVVHVVMRRDERKKAKADNRNMPYASYWYEPDGGRDLLRESGFEEMPFFFTRWDDARGIYGTGPGDEAKSEQKGLESYELRKAVGLEKMIDPPMVAPGSLGVHLKTYAGAINKDNGFTSGQPNSLRALYEINFGPALGAVQEEIQNISQRIDDIMMASVFASIPLDQRPADMSATEFMARRREAIQLMGPALSAYEPNVLNKVLERTYAILDRNGLMPPPPDQLGEFAILDVEYLSPMAQALRQSGAESTQALLQSVVPVVQMNQESMDKLNFDQMIDELARGLSAPGSVVRSDEEVAVIREQRAQAMAAQQQIAMEQAAADQAAKLGNVRTEGTVAGAVLGEEGAE